MSISRAQKTIGIIGAAVAGPVLALQILSHPVLRKLYKPVIYDQDTDAKSTPTKVLHTAGAAVALSANGLSPLYELGLRGAIDEMSCEFTGASIWRAYHGPEVGIGQNVNAVEPGKYKYLNGSRNPSWAADLQTNMRIIERRHLQSLLLDRIYQLGGEVFWNKRVERLVKLKTGAVKVTFGDEDEIVADLLVGADGGWSEVRKHILKQRNEQTAEERWIPEFWGASGFYGISSQIDGLSDHKDLVPHALTDTHALWLDQGNLSTSPLPNGKIRWDLILPDKHAPRPLSSHPAAKRIAQPSLMAEWESKIIPGAYSHASTVEILRRHVNIWHPATGTFGRLLSASERIIRSPLRQRVWKEEEIQFGNAAVIGDAARLMLPSSGQGKHSFLSIPIYNCIRCNIVVSKPHLRNIGSSFAIEDATVLANALLNNPPSPLHDDCFQAALREYARLRVPRSRRMAQTAHWAGVLGIGEKWYWRWLRDFGSRMPLGKDPKL